MASPSASCLQEAGVWGGVETCRVRTQTPALAAGSHARRGLRAALGSPPCSSTRISAPCARTPSPHLTGTGLSGARILLEASPFASIALMEACSRAALHSAFAALALAASTAALASSLVLRTPAKRPSRSKDAAAGAAAAAPAAAGAARARFFPESAPEAAGAGAAEGDGRWEEAAAEAAEAEEAGADARGAPEEPLRRDRAVGAAERGCGREEEELMRRPRRY